MMTPAKMAGFGLIFLLIFLFGFWLSRSGKPYNTVIFTIHKLIAVGGAVFLGVTLVRIHQAAPLTALQLAVIGLAAVCLLATIVTGGLLSIAKPMPAFVQALHRGMPYLTVLSTSAIFYLLLARGSGG